MSLATAVSTVAEAGHELAPLWMPAPMFAVAVGAFLLVLGVVTFSYRDVANRRGDTHGEQHADGHDSH